MSYPQEDLNVDSEQPDVSSPMSPTVVHQTTTIIVSEGANVHLQVGDNNQQHQLSKSTENLSQCCERCGSTSSSPVTTIKRSQSVDNLDSQRECYSPAQDCEPQGLVDSLRRRFENTLNPAASSPIVIQGNFQRPQISHDPLVSNNSFTSEISIGNSIPGDVEIDCPSMDDSEEHDNFIGRAGAYIQQESDNSSNYGSESSDVDNTSIKSEPPLLPRRLPKVPAKKTKTDRSILVDDEEDYVSMTGSSGSLNDPHTQSIPRDPKTRDQRCKTSGKIPEQKIDEAHRTPGFRSDVSGELKRVRRILRPHKSKDGYYVLWQFSEYVLSLSVTFLGDIKNFAVIYDSTNQSWLILKNGPRSSSLSTLMQLYTQNRIKLPLSKGQSKRVSLSSTPQKNQPTFPKPMTRKTSFVCADNKPPPLPPRRASAPTLIPSGSPLLPPKPQGFLTLQIPVVQ